MSVTHIYDSPGTYVVTLTATNSIGSVDTSKSITIQSSNPSGYVRAYNKSDIISSTTYTGDYIHFEVYNTTNPPSAYKSLYTLYTWYINDTKLGTYASYGFTPTTSGIYNVYATLSNEWATGKTVTYKHTVITPDPTACFSFSPTNPIQGEDVLFTNCSAYATGYIWEFGDNETSTLENPVHEYDSPGTYTISLHSYGNTSALTTNTITVEDASINIDFTGIPTSAATTSTKTVIFYPSVSGYGNMSYAWYYIRYPLYDSQGSFATSWTKFSSSEIASQSFGIGQYDIKLTVNNEWTTVSNTKLKYVTLTEPLPVVDFSASPTSGYVDLTVSFTDKTTNIPITWIWDFGDSATSYLQNPIHIYNTAGTYTVKLSASNYAGTATKTSTITAYEHAATDIVYSYSIVDHTATFTASSSYANEYMWNFGDGNMAYTQTASNTYSNSGTYEVTIYAINSSGTISKSFNIEIAGAQMMAPIMF